MNKEALIRRLNSKLWFRLYLFKVLPAAFFSGIRLGSVAEGMATAQVRYSWFSKNPFQSIYFACLCMAAEMSSGVLALLHTYTQEPKVSMLVLSMQSQFIKKAKGNIRFICSDGMKIKEAVDKAIQTGEGVVCETVSEGFDDLNTCVARFTIQWTFKKKNRI